MYFLDNHQLAVELRKGIDEYTKMKYLIFTLTLYYVIFELLNKSDIPVLFDPFSGIVGLIIMVGGIYFSYRINIKGDNKDFLTRFVCLSWPITIKSMLIAIALVIIPIMIFSSLTLVQNIFYFSFIFSIIFQFSFFYMMMRSLRTVSEKRKKK